MRLTLTFLLLCAMATMTFAQINANSPFPADFEILNPATGAGVYPYGAQSAADDGTTPIWGPELTATVAGEVAWGYNALGDSLGCETITTDLTGKMALIRRGVCGFSLKAYNAQQAGAIGCIIVNHYTGVDDNATTIVRMLGGDSISAVTIPAVFISRSTGEILLQDLDAGSPVSASFTIKSFYDPITSFSYHTPLSDAVEFNSIGARYVNPSSDEVEVTLTAVITSPTGVETTLTGSKAIPSLQDSLVTVDGGFTPTELGEYNVVLTNDQNAEVLESKFITTDYTFATNSEITTSVGPSATQFLDAGFNYQVGSLAIMDGDGAVATYASFGIANAASIFTGDPDADQIAIVLYDGDFNDDGLIDFAGGVTSSFNDLAPVALATYTITGQEDPEALIFVEWEDLTDGDNLVELKPDGAYYTVLAYDGTEAGLGVAPRFLASEDVPYLNFPTTPLVLDQFYSGWAGQTVAIGLHLAGFQAPVGTEDLIALDATKVTLAPNPVSSRLNVMFNLDQTADKVQMIMTDVSGKIITTEEYEQVLNQSIEIDMQRLPRGSYFLSIATPEGYRVERVIKQ
jgi:hypothetical protein